MFLMRNVIYAKCYEYEMLPRQSVPYEMLPRQSVLYEMLPMRNVTYTKCYQYQMLLRQIRKGEKQISIFSISMFIGTLCR